MYVCLSICLCVCYVVDIQQMGLFISCDDILKPRHGNTLTRKKNFLDDEFYKFINDNLLNYSVIMSKFFKPY